VGWALAVTALVIVRLGPFTPASVCVFRALVRQDGLVVWGRRPGDTRPVYRFISRQADYPSFKII
jgi:hypothetical protein